MNQIISISKIKTQTNRKYLIDVTSDLMIDDVRSHLPYAYYIGNTSTSGESARDTDLTLFFISIINVDGVVIHDIVHNPVKWYTVSVLDRHP